MKKITLVLALMASFFAFAGCSSNTTTGQTAAPAAPSAHHDYKGEVGSK